MSISTDAAGDGCGAGGVLERDRDRDVCIDGEIIVVVVVRRGSAGCGTVSCGADCGNAW